MLYINVLHCRVLNTTLNREYLNLELHNPAKVSQNWFNFMNYVTFTHTKGYQMIIYVYHETHFYS